MNIVNRNYACEISHRDSKRLPRRVPPHPRIEDNNNSKVKFSSVQIREYPICIGDNPSVQCGPPLAISWKHVHERKYDINSYERQFLDYPRRRCLELMIPKVIREKKLLAMGYTRDDIRVGTIEVNRARNKRMQTLKTIHQESLNEMMELAYRGTLNLVVCNRKEKERLFLERCMELDRSKHKKQKSIISNKRNQPSIMVEQSESGNGLAHEVAAF